MVCCVAVGSCSVQSRQGIKLHRFPRGLERRRVWTVKVKRVNWTPPHDVFFVRCKDSFISLFPSIYFSPIHTRDFVPSLHRRLKLYTVSSLIHPFCRPTDLSSMFAVVVCIVVVVCVVHSQRDLSREDKRLKSDAVLITRMKNSGVVV